MFRNRTEAERIHHSDGSCAHGENVAQDSADACRGALKRFDVGRMIVRLDFERHAAAVADVDDARIFTGPLQYRRAPRGQPLQVDAGNL